MTTLLKQLEFLFGAHDSKTHMHFGNSTLCLEIKNAQNLDLVQRIATKMGIAASTEGSVVKLYLATPLKENVSEIPETEFQKTVNRLIYGHGDVMGLKELTSYLYQSNKYSTHDVYFHLSAIEKNYIQTMGWNIDFTSGLGYVQGKVFAGPHGCDNVRIQNRLLSEFLKGLHRFGTHYIRKNEKRMVMCGFGSDYYLAEDAYESSWSHSFFRTGDYGRNMEDLITFFVQNTLVFPNGQRITLNTVNKRSIPSGKHDYRCDFEWSITNPSTSSRWYIMMKNVASSKGVKHFHENGLLQQYLDVEHCECKPKAVTVKQESLDLIRDAVSSYMEGGVYTGFGHTIVGDSLELWLTKDSDNVKGYNPTQLRRTRSAFNEAVDTLTKETLDSYDNPITIV